MFSRTIVSAIWSITCIVASNGLQAQTLESILNKVPNAYLNKREDVEKALTKFRVDETKTNDSLVKELDGQAKVAAKNGGNPTSQAFINEVDELKTWVKLGGELPKCDQTLPLVFKYAETLFSARSKIDNPLNTLLKSLEKDKRTGLADEIKEAYSKLGGILDGTNVFKNGSVFAGFRKHSNSANLVTLKMKINNLNGGNFSGTVERDWMFKGHPIHLLGGEIRGMYFRAQTGKTEAMGNNLDGTWIYEGYVVGKSIVGQFYGVGLKGKPGGGLFRVDLR